VAITYENTRASYAKMWRSMSIPQDKLATVDKAAKRIIAAKGKYAAAEKATGVPWYFIGLLHLRESNLRFDRHLHNGDPLTARTRLVPAGHPKTGSPPFTFDESAIDALKIKNFHKIRDWTVERLLYESERYNGFGYMHRKGHNSPYVWGASNHQTRGKFVADHKFDPKHMDKQLGVAAILKRIIDLDHSAAPVMADDVKTGLEPVRRSVSLKSLIGGLFVGIFGGLLEGFHLLADGVSGAVTLLPSAVAEGQVAAESAAAVATWLKLESGTIVNVAAVAVMALVFYREYQRKKVQP